MASEPNSPPSDANEALERLGGLCLRGLSMDRLLQTVADLASSVMPGNPEASVTLLIEDRPVTVVARRAGPRSRRAAVRARFGPCQHAARTGELTGIADARTDTRWPDYLPHAVGRGILCSTSVRWRWPRTDPSPERSTSTRGGRTPSTRTAGRSPAGWSCTLGRRQQPVRLPECSGPGRQPEAGAAVPRGHRPGQGVLVERYELTPDQAFQLLAQTSMRLDRKVRDIADHLVRTGELLGAQPPAGGLDQPGARWNRDGSGAPDRP